MMQNNARLPVMNGKITFRTDNLPLVNENILFNPSSSLYNYSKVETVSNTIFTFSFVQNATSIQQWDFSFQTTKRGCFQIENLECIIADPFQLIHIHLLSIHKLRTEILVYPSLKSVVGLQQVFQTTPGTYKTTLSFNQDESTIIGIKPYERESFRSIHWKASAKMQQLHAKQYQPVLNHSWSICLCLSYITLLLTSHNKKQQVSRTIMLIGLSITSFLLLKIGIYFRMGLFYVIYMILPGISYAVTPLFELIPTKTSNKIVQVWQNTYGNKSQLKEEIVSSSNSNHSSQLPNTLIGITILLLMSYVVYRILKRQNGLKIKETNILPAVFMPNKAINGTRNKKVKAPENSFRFIIFQLEQQLQHPFSRNRGETLEDWLLRLKGLGISMNEMLIIHSYNEARYSQNKLDSHLLTSLEKEIEHIISQQKKRRSNVNSKKH